MISQECIRVDVDFGDCSYNKKESDFATLREYNDYLEEVETISKWHPQCNSLFNAVTKSQWSFSFVVFNLVNDIDIESTRKKVEAYKKDNKELITKNRFKKVPFSLSSSANCWSYLDPYCLNVSAYVVPLIDARWATNWRLYC